MNEIYRIVREVQKRTNITDDNCFSHITEKGFRIYYMNFIVTISKSKHQDLYYMLIFEDFKHTYTIHNLIFDEIPIYILKYVFKEESAKLDYSVVPPVEIEEY